jgi:hypothetical protein
MPLEWKKFTPVSKGALKIVPKSKKGGEDSSGHSESRSENAVSSPQAEITAVRGHPKTLKRPSSTGHSQS